MLYLFDPGILLNQLNQLLNLALTEPPEVKVLQIISKTHGILMGGQIMARSNGPERGQWRVVLGGARCGSELVLQDGVEYLLG